MTLCRKKTLSAGRHVYSSKASIIYSIYKLQKGSILYPMYIKFTLPFGIFCLQPLALAEAFEKIRCFCLAKHRLQTPNHGMRIFDPTFDLSARPAQNPNDRRGSSEELPGSRPWKIGSEKVIKPPMPFGNFWKRWWTYYFIILYVFLHIFTKRYAKM